MRIVVHDYAGHPFQVQLSRELARRGNHILHLHFESFPTPKGPLRARGDDPPQLNIEGIRFPGGFCKYGNFLLRRSQEIRYGKLAAQRIAAFRPDAVISANTPLDAQVRIQRTVRRLGASFTFWLQDLYSVGIESCLRKSRVPLAPVIGAWYRNLERNMLRASDAVIPVSRDFCATLDRWVIDPARIQTIENWAPVDELPTRPQANIWSRAAGLAGKFVFLYSGTLGMKHDPGVLVDLAESMRHRPEVVVAVVSEGLGAEWLRRNAEWRGLSNLRVLPLQPWELMSHVFASASVLVTLLDEAAGEFSVPSKVLSYLCAGRPLLAAVPSRNAAARIVAKTPAGLLVSPNDTPAFLAAAEELYRDPALRERFAENARALAESSFRIGPVASCFETVLAAAAAASKAPAATAKPLSAAPLPRGSH